MSGPCMLCSRVVALTAVPRAAHEAVGEYQMLRSNAHCSTCRRLANMLEKKGSIFQDTIETQDKIDIFWQEPVLHIRLRKIGIDLIRLEHTFVPSSDPNGSLNLSFLKTAIRNCDIYHEGDCHSTPIGSEWVALACPTAGVLMIDVEHGCLVSQALSCSYVALSYVWGVATNESAILQTTRKNLAGLSKQGAFDALGNYDLLPATIRDSIALTRMLGLRYLWVDRFCIVQDDHDHKYAQLDLMAKIYTNAYLTIAACEGSDDEHGLPGISSREQPYKVLEFGPRSWWVNQFPVDWRDIKTVYNTRGWTFQEWLLSPRKLAFHNSTVTWLCKHTKLMENGHSTAGQVPPAQLPNLIPIPTKGSCPDIHCYYRLVEQYTRRILSYPEDALAAFTAVMVHMGSSMRGGILFGVPEMLFDGSLLWYPSSRGSKRRRDRSGKRIKTLPSWSWAAWEGKIDTQICREAFPWEFEHTQGYVKAPNADMTLRPLLDWYKTDAVTGISTRVHNKLYIRHPLNEQSVDVPLDQLPAPVFQYSLPVPPVSPSHHRQSNTVLEIRTHRLHLFAKAQRLDLKPRFMNLYDLHGKNVGFLYEIPLECLEGDSAHVFACEAICIAAAEYKWNPRTYFSFGDADLAHRDCPDLCYMNQYLCRLPQEWRYRTYFVLWIEREDGIAYRKALGEVSRQFWDGAGAEEIDVRLG